MGSLFSKENRQRNFIVLRLVVPLTIFGLLGSLSAAIPGFKCGDEEKNVTLDFWNVFDDSDIFLPLIKDFTSEYRNVKINYYKKLSTSYETELVNALAVGRGPDIFAINNTWLPKHKDKIAPLSEELMSVKEYRDTFVEVAVKDFIDRPVVSSDKEQAPEQIYAIPLFVDTLALYWNKDIFNSEGIAQPPKDWHEFNQVVEKLIKKDASGNIVQSAVSLGTAKNINRATDILSMLMLQTGTIMVDNKKEQATFNQSVTSGNRTYKSGVDSLRFYTDFANPTKKIYTWNDNMDYSIDAFAQGRAAMMINYAYHLPTIKAKDPHLRFDVATLPQPRDAQVIVNYANYWGLTVSAAASKTEQKYAWIFIKWLSEQPQAKRYLKAAARPTSRRDLVSWQEPDLELGVFAHQSLSAKSWYQIDNLAIEKIFTEMIEAVNYGYLSVGEAIDRAANQVTLLMKK